MRRYPPVQSLFYHLASPPLSPPPPSPPSSLLHLRTLHHRTPPSPTPPSSSPLPRPPHNPIPISTRHPNPNLHLTSAPTPRHYCRCCWESSSKLTTTSPRRKFSSTPSSFLSSENSGKSGGLGSARREYGSDGEGELDREWELELEEGEEQQQQQQQEREQGWRRQQQDSRTLPLQHLRQARRQQRQHQQQQQEQEQQREQQKEQRQPGKILSPTPISEAQYHSLADLYIETLVNRLEEIQELREDLDCEYSSGVLTISFPPTGTYVLNKQPPNKQIWLSSPISGPKRYDYLANVTTALDDGKGPGGEEEVGGKRKAERGCRWIYLRDGSSLTELLREELGVEIEVGYGEEDRNGREE